MLDVGCGRGMATRIFAKRFPNSHFTGIDIRQANIDIAREAASSAGLTNVQYVCGDAKNMPTEWTASFDYAFIFNVLHDAPRPDLIVDEVKRVSKKDSYISVFEFDFDSKLANNIERPLAALSLTISLFHCLPMSYYFPDSFGLGLAWGKENVLEFLQSKGLEVTMSKVKGINETHFLCKPSSE